MKKVYVISMEDNGKTLNVKRHNLGFSPHELLGLAVEIQSDILQQMRGKQKPHIVVRQVTKFIEKEEK